MPEKKTEPKEEPNKETEGRTKNYEKADLREDVEEIMEEVSETSKDVDELKEEVEEIKEDISEISEIARTSKSIMEKISQKLRLPIPSRFNVSDVAQQVVGAIILSTPFTVTEEVWGLAGQLDLTRIALIIFLTVAFDVVLIYFSKFQHIDVSNKLNVFARIFSIIMISYLAAGLLLYTFGVIGNRITDPAWAIKLIILVGLPANIGAATADILK